MNRPGKLLEPERLLLPGATGYVAWTMRSEEPGTRMLVEALIEVSSRSPIERGIPLPLWLNSWLANRQRRNNERKLKELFPMVVAWVVRPGHAPHALHAPEDDLHLLTLSVQKIGNRARLIDWFLGFALSFSSKAETVSYRDEDIYLIPVRPGRQVAAFIRGNDFYFASDLDLARQALDSLAQAAQSEGAPARTTALYRLYAATPSGSALRGALLNEHGEIFRIRRWITRKTDASGSGADRAPDQAPWDEIKGITLFGGFTGEGSFEGTVECWYADAELAGRNASALTDEVRSALERASVEADVQGAAEGERVRIRVRIDDVPAKIDKLIERQVRSRG